MTRSATSREVSGTLTASGGAAKVRNVTRTRHFFEALARRKLSSQVLSESQSPFPVGSQKVEGTFVYSVDQLSQNAQDWISDYDRYRVTNVEVFVTLTTKSRNGSVDRTAPVTLYFYEDTDADSSITTSWIRVSDRDNLGRVVLHATNPSMRLISFKPTASFFATSSSSASPANMIPKKDMWIDALALKQQLSGLRFFGGCPQTDASGQSYDFALVFEARYTVQVQQPL